MTEREKERLERVEDPQVSAAYRALGAAEPSRALDEAIVAAARRPAKPFAQRWAVPLSLAAVVVLSVVVTLRVQEEQPELASVQAPVPAPAPVAHEAAQPEALKLKVEDRLKSVAKPAPKAAARNVEPKPFPQARSDRAPAAAGAGVAQAPAAPPSGAAGELASRRATDRSAEMRYRDSALRHEEERVERDAEAAARAPQAAAALAKRPAPQSAAPAKPAPAKAMADSAEKATAETPERELERIARLRAEGKHDEADKALAEFRKRYPDYLIAEDMLRRVERR